MSKPEYRLRILNVVEQKTTFVPIADLHEYDDHVENAKTLHPHSWVVLQYHCPKHGWRDSNEGECWVCEEEQDSPIEAYVRAHQDRLTEEWLEFALSL
jgi:hypothetical protein